MQNKKARRAAAAVNRFLDPTLNDPNLVSQEKKIGKAIPRNRRDFSKIIQYIDNSLRRQDPTLPRDLSVTHYLTVNTLQAIAFRDNMVEEDIKCPHCKQFLKVIKHNSKSECNSVKALEILTDRMFPKLASLTHEINVAGQINVITEQLATIIVKYVPAEMKMVCLGEITELIDTVQRNEQQKAISNANGLTLSA